MRHRKSGYTLSRKTNERKALFLSLIRTFFEHGHLETTSTKAKAILRELERFSTLAVRGDLSARRELFKVLQSQSWVNNICQTMAKEFPDKKDNFTIVKNIKYRQGDDSLIVRVSFTKDVSFSKEKLKTAKAEVVQEVAPAQATKKATIKVTTRAKKK